MICRMKNTSTRKLLSVRQGERMGKVQKGCEEAYPGAGRVYVNETGMPVRHLCGFIKDRKEEKRETWP